MTPKDLIGKELIDVQDTEDELAMLFDGGLILLVRNQESVVLDVDSWEEEWDLG